MSRFKQSLGNAKLAILSLFIALVLSFILNLCLGFMLFKVPTNMTVFVPPQIPDGGFEGKANEISAEQVYRFAYSTWTNLNSWSNDGSKAYPAKLTENAPYLTQTFQNVLKQDMSQMNEQGFLYHHTQISYGMAGSSFDAQDVQYTGNGTWLVHLEIRTINYVESTNQNGGFGVAHVASDAETSFVFKVTRFPIVKGYNTSGLVLAGYGVQPKVVKVYN